MTSPSRPAREPNARGWTALRSFIRSFMNPGSGQPICRPATRVSCPPRSPSRRTGNIAISTWTVADLVASPCPSQSGLSSSGPGLGSGCSTGATMSLLMSTWALVRFFAGLVQGGGTDAEQARDIADHGREWALRAPRHEDMQIYMFRLLLEWGLVVDDNRHILGFPA